MNKSEILANIAARDNISDIIETKLVETINNIKVYTSSVLEISGDLGWKRSINFYVVDEGEAGEVAYFYRQDPGSNLPVEDIVKTAINDYMNGQAGIISYEIVEYFSANKAAEIQVYKIIDGSTANKENWIVYKDGSNPIEHRILV